MSISHDYALVLLSSLRGGLNISRIMEATYFGTQSIDFRAFELSFHGIPILPKVQR